jgi:hypothetical protein
MVIPVKKLAVSVLNITILLDVSLANIQMFSDLIYIEDNASAVTYPVACCATLQTFASNVKFFIINKITHAKYVQWDAQRVIILQLALVVKLTFI